MHVIRILLANVLGIWLADVLVAGFAVYGGYMGYLIGGVLLGLLIIILKPILKMVSGPLIIVTLGLFILVINGFIIWLLDYLTVYVDVILWLPLVWATLVITAVNLIAQGNR